MSSAATRAHEFRIRREKEREAAAQLEKDRKLAAEQDKRDWTAGPQMSEAPGTTVQEVLGTTLGTLYAPPYHASKLAAEQPNPDGNTMQDVGAMSALAGGYPAPTLGGLGALGNFLFKETKENADKAAEGEEVYWEQDPRTGSGIGLKWPILDAALAPFDLFPYLKGGKLLLNDLPKAGIEALGRRAARGGSLAVEFDPNALADLEAARANMKEALDMTQVPSGDGPMAIIPSFPDEAKRIRAKEKIKPEERSPRRKAFKSRREIDIARKLDEPAPKLDLTGYNLFDYSKLGQGRREISSLLRPEPAQSKFSRLPSEIKDLVTDDYVRENLQRAIERGSDFYDWYDLSQLKKAWKDAGLSDADFSRYMQYQQAAAQNIRANKQVQIGNYLWNQDRLGLLTPGAPMKFPPGYGSKSQRPIWENAKGIAQGKPIESEKLLSYNQNYIGNLGPATIDTHALRLPAMLSHDPRMIKTQIREAKQANPDLKKMADYRISDDGKYQIWNPRKSVEQGKISMEEALERPGIWRDTPTGSTYGAVEQYLFKPMAWDLGIPTASAQAGSWVGGGNITGLRSPPKLMLQLFEDEIKRLASKYGLSEKEALNQMMQGRIF